MEYVFTKRYDNHYGLDLKSDDLSRSIKFASLIKNAQYRKSGAIEKRPGFQAHAASVGGFGQFTYNRVDPVTGIEAPVEVTFNQTPYKLNFSTLNVTYVGSDATALLSIFFDTVSDEYRCQILEGSLTVLDMALGLGFDEASPVTISDLSVAIDALANFTSSVTGATTTPAAFLKITRDWDLASSGGAFAGLAGYWTAINTTVTNPFSGYYAHRNDTDFENVSVVQLNNVLFCTNGYDEVHKYDGQTFYRAGVPNPPSLTSAVGAAGAITGNNYLWKAQIVQKDAVGNFIEGNWLVTTPIINLAAQRGTLTVGNVLAGTGFNTNGALVNGNQVGVTVITVTNSPHTMQVGDTAYFLDRSTGNYVERVVTARTATTITIAGAAVNVNNGDAISNNLRIVLYRSKTSGSTPTVFYVVNEIPNNSFAATQTYDDNKTDAQLGEQFIEPLTDRSPPPKGKYNSAFAGLHILAGDLMAPNTVYFSDVDGSEYFPNTGTNEFDVPTPKGEIISGLAPNNEVFAIFKDPGIVIVSGDLATGQIKVDHITSDIGCKAHATIKEVKGALCFLDSKGPYRMVGGQIPRPLGELVDPETQQVYGRLEPVFDQRGKTDAFRLNLKKAVAINHGLAEKYILFLPVDTSQFAAGNWASANSRVFAYDYSRDAWLEWNNLNMAGGLSVLGDELYWQERRYSDFTLGITNVMYRQLNLGDAWDYQDNDIAVDWDYGAQWETLDYPKVSKRFIRVGVYSLEEIPNNDFSVNVQTEVDFIKDAPKADFTLDLSGGGYGVAAYGTGPYGDPSESSPDHPLSRGRFGSLRLRFKNNTPQQNVVINGWELEIATPYRLVMKK